MTDHVDDPWAEYAADWDDDEGARTYATSAHAHLLDVLTGRGPSVVGARILDFGAGTGLLTERLAADAAHIDAVDSSTAMLDELRAKIARRGWRHVTAAAELSDASGTYDLVVASSVLTFVDDLDTTVSQLAARLRPGGALIHWDWERTDTHDHGLTRGEIRAAMNAAGLVDVVAERAFRFRIEGDEVWPVYGAGWAPPDQPGG